MTLRDLIKELQDIADLHGDYLDVKVEQNLIGWMPNGQARGPTVATQAYFTYNDDESEAWVIIE